MKLFIFGAGFLFVCFVYARPSTNHANDVRNCYGFTCPEGTTTCIRNITTTPDDKYIRTDIVCKNTDGIELDSQVTSKDNSNSGVKVSSHSYKGQYVLVSDGKSININVG